MAQNWIFSVRPENWDTVKSKQIFAVDRESTKEKIHPSDRLLLYVSGGSYSFGGIFEVRSPWHEVKKPQFPDEENQSRVLYRFAVGIKPEAVGVADVRKIKGALSFIGDKQHWSTYFQRNPGNHGKPISDEDYNLILQELQRNPQEWSIETPAIPVEAKAWLSFSTRTETATTVPVTEPLAKRHEHPEIINLLMTIGEVFGFKPQREPSINDIRPQNKVFASKEKELDVGWDLGIGAWVPVEVQVHGKVSDLMYRLNLVHQWSHRMIVVAEGRDYEEVREASKTFPFQDKIVLVKPDEVFKASDSLEGLRDLRRKIFQ